MNRLRFLVCAMLGVAATAYAADAPPIQGPLYITSYIEVAPSAAASALATVKSYRDATRKEPGATSADIYREKGFPSRFVISEVWKDEASLNAHAKAASSLALENAIKPVSYKPVDVRPHTPYILTPAKAPKAGDVFVISHIDVYGPGVSVLQAAFKDLTDAAKREKGMVQFEVLDQTVPHANHYRLFEEWASEKDWEAHNLGAAVQGFHAKLPVFLGTPYDQRLYDLVN